MSAQFSMVNANENDPIHDLGHFNVDGGKYRSLLISIFLFVTMNFCIIGYIPRIFFMDSAGEVLNEIENTQGNPKYKYFYHNAESVIVSMKKVLEKLDKDTKTEL